MPAMTAIGEIGIEVEGRSYLLRPSLFSVSQIGTPAEIVQTCAILQAAEPLDPELVPLFRRERFLRALTVWYACANGQDIGDLVGGLAPANPANPVTMDDYRGACSFEEINRLAQRHKPRYSPGLLPMADIVAIAKTLVRHGVLGDAAPTETIEDVRPAEKDDYLSEFHAVSYASAAVAHLGMSELQAWNMTMTGFIAAMRAKFPPSEKDKDKAKPATPTAKEVDRAMANLAKINAAREAASK